MESYKRLKINVLGLFFQYICHYKKNNISTPQKHTRLIYIDALRSFAILMMLQGHFISSLLNDKFKDTNNITYQIWDYFRGITAPTFFTITGFVFLFLVLKQPDFGWKNIRVKKGIVRGLKLIGWGYILRLGIGGIFVGQFHEAYLYTDVLHIIGISIIILCILYVAIYRYKVLGITLLFITLFSFLFERYYDGVTISFLPHFLTHYLTNVDGAVFTLFPWFGYVSMGGFLATQFVKFQQKDNFYFLTPLYLGLLGLFLIYYSSPVLFYLHEIIGLEIFLVSANYNYLFSRLGDVLVLFTLFVYAKNWIKHPLFIKIGKVTLSIYIVHHIILYGSWFDTGMCRWFYNSLTLTQALVGALVFMIITTTLVLKYRDVVNQYLATLQQKIRNHMKSFKLGFVRR